MMRLSLAMLAAALLLTTIFAISTTAASGFVANDGSLSFALNIPNENSDPTGLYMAISGPSSSSWIAIGMGNNKMDNTLMFLVYADSTGKNVTVSPRLSYGHVEPSYDANLTYSLASGSGISNGTMTAYVMCNNCRSWKGGSIDSTNTAANFIFASGPHGSINSNSSSANTKRHTSYGTFTMDLTKAVGARNFPDVITADISGTVQSSEKTDHDFSVSLHAGLMILSFVVLMPIGIIILSVKDSVKWHSINQTVSAVLSLLGAFLGLYCGTMYNRTKNFNNAHQILGIAITITVIAQFVIGLMHHRIYKRTSTTTKLATVHIWLGRHVISAGITNGFLGFPLALNPKYNLPFGGLTLVVVIVLGSVYIWRWRSNTRQRQTTGTIENDSDATNLSETRRAESRSQSDINLSQMRIPHAYES